MLNTQLMEMLRNTDIDAFVAHVHVMEIEAREALREDAFSMEAEAVVGIGEWLAMAYAMKAWYRGDPDAAEAIDGGFIDEVHESMKEAE